MSDDATRFRVIEGGNAPDQSRVDPRMRRYACQRCTEAQGFAETKLVRLRVGALERDGRLRGGSLWWCCARCLEPKFFIRHFR